MEQTSLKSSSRNTITVTVYGRHVEMEWTFPARWEICSDCEGCATDRGASVECDGGGFTASEWAEQDDDFKDDYLAGRYDRACPYCKGLGRIQVIDEERVGGWRDQIALKSHYENVRGFAEIEAIHAAERRMGA